MSVRSNKITPIGIPSAALCQAFQTGLGRHVTVGMVLLFPCILLVLTYRESFTYLLDQWIDNDNYSHGILVPFISAFLIWLRRIEIGASAQTGSWLGLVMVATGIVLYVIGELATLFIILHVSFWCILVGLLLSAIGTRALASLAFPLGYLLTAVPLPQFLYQGLSGKLQLISSAWGVGCLQFIGITAFRDGNVIDLGPIQLQVVDACSGIRYLFPLATLALLCGYLFRDQLWKRIVLVLSSIPISIVLNGFRIGMIGVLVEHFGQSAAEGFYHLFEGWVLFMASLGILLTEMWILRRIGSPPAEQPRNTAVSAGSQSSALAVSILLRPTYLYSVGLLALLPLASAQLSDRGEIVPSRQPFLDFPMQMDRWSGTFFPLETRYIETLRFDDYVLADYHLPHAAPVNLYIAYYRSQRKGQSAHSPQSCIPGGGWEIASTHTVQLASTIGENQPANRVLIQKGDQRQLVLYWFKQRERIVANEYLVKLYVLWDSMTRQRTDGALIRLTTPIQQNERDESAEQRLLQFAQDMNPILTRYVPD